MGKSSDSFDVAIGRAHIPVHVFYEYRRNVRIASGKDAVLLRIPRYCSTAQRNRFLEWGKNWVFKQWESNPRFRATYFRFNVLDISEIQTFDARYRVEITQSTRKSGRAQIYGDRLDVKLPDQLSEAEQTEVGYRAIHSAFARAYLPKIETKVKARHADRFDKPVKSVRLRNMSSKWGSCSNSGNVSLSTRLLFVPEGIQDYVIWHELCHLEQLNHSPAFWQLVEQGEPHYKAKEQWLVDKGHLSDIQFVSKMHATA